MYADESNEDEITEFTKSGGITRSYICVVFVVKLYLLWYMTMHLRVRGVSMNKVYVVREYGGSYDDSWEHIMGIFTDKAKADEFRDSYWQSLEARREAIHKIFEKSIDKLQIDSDDEDYWKAVNENYDLDDIVCVEVKEYPLNEIVNRYYVEEK